VGGAQLQHHCHVLLRLHQLYLREVHNGGAFDDQELDVEQRVVTADCLKGQIILRSLHANRIVYMLVKTSCTNFAAVRAIAPLHQAADQSMPVQKAGLIQKGPDLERRPSEDPCRPEPATVVPGTASF